MQTAVSTNCVLHGINLKNSYSLERERSSYMLFAMLLDALLNKLVRTVDVSASGTIQTVSVSIDLYVEIRFNPRSLLTNPQSSPEITDNKCFAGCWNNMTFCLWGRGVEVLVDPFTLSGSNQTRLIASLFCDVGVRYPGAFGVTAAVS